MNSGRTWVAMVGWLFAAGRSAADLRDRAGYCSEIFCTPQ